MLKHLVCRLVANLLAVAGCDHVITMDLHASQIQGFFDIPCDNLLSEMAMVSYIKTEIDGWREGIIVSPDAGGAKRATALADRLNLDFALINRKRKNRQHQLAGGCAGSGSQMSGSIYSQLGSNSGTQTPTQIPTGATTPSVDSSSIFANGGSLLSNASSAAAAAVAAAVAAAEDEDDRPDNMELLVGDVRGKTAILIDDMIDTGHTVKLATEVLKESGAKEIYVLICHGLLSDLTMKTLKDLPIKKLMVSGIDHSASCDLNLVADKLESQMTQVTNSIDQSSRVQETEGKMGTIDIAPLIAESIRRTHNG